jgi:RNA polymerase sigma factor for flagellar operon FliA
MKEREDLWKQYAETCDPALREEIIVQNVPLVRYVLGRLTIPALDAEVYEDLVSQGILGLIDAVDRFEPERGLRFSTYATLRIRGHILDALRAMDILPRSARRRVKEIKRTIAQLRMKLGREPHDDEVASVLNLDRQAYQSALIEANCAILSLDTSFEMDADGRTPSLQSLLCDEDNAGPEESLEQAELLRLLTAAFRQLPHRTQLLLSFYYYEGLTMKEIGQVLNLSESRVSQLHARAIIGLRAALEQNAQSRRPAPVVRLSRPVPAPVFAAG